jgi:chemotaxis methyl-accepting protein methylase
MDRVHGIDVSGFETTFLERTLERRLHAAGYESASRYLTERLPEDRAEAQAFHHLLLVGYSTFFRNPLVFSLLETQILPDLAEKAKRSGRSSLRVWSAGCAAGQEAWSMAILLDETTSLFENQMAWRVFGTDLSEPDLSLAKAGVYTNTEIGNVRLRHIGKYFTQQGEVSTISELLRKRVEFSLYDLLDRENIHPPASIFGDFDLVLCCNVLIYYKPAQQSRILDKLLGSLSSGGYLVTGEAERRTVLNNPNVRELMPAIPVFQSIRGDP